MVASDSGEVAATRTANSVLLLTTGQRLCRLVQPRLRGEYADRPKHRPQPRELGGRCSVGAERRSEQGHVVFLEDRRDCHPVGCPTSGRRAELFIELVAASRRVDHDHLAGLVRPIEECVWHLCGEIGEASFLAGEVVFADLDLVAALQDVDRLLLLVVDMQGRATVRSDLDDEVVESATCVLAGDLEDQVSPRAGLEPKPFVWGENRLRGCRHVQVSSLIRSFHTTRRPCARSRAAAATTICPDGLRRGHR